MWSEAGPGRPWLPDALVDTTRRRKLTAGRRLGGGLGLLPRLLVAADHALAWSVVPLGWVPGLDLYSQATAAQARQVARAVLGKTPAWVTLERGKEGGLHLNILHPAAARLAWPPKTWRRVLPSGDALKVLTYLSKPADARACSSRHPVTGYRSRPTPADLAEALVDYTTARQAAHEGGRRLPMLAWTVNLPRLRPDAPVVPDREDELAAKCLRVVIVPAPQVLVEHRPPVLPRFPARLPVPVFPGAAGPPAAIGPPVPKLAA